MASLSLLQTSRSISQCLSLQKPISSSSLPFSCHSQPSLSIETIYTRPAKPSHICRESRYQFPKPIPAFAETETDKFREHMLARLTEKNKYFGTAVEKVVNVCTEIMRTFLHRRYRGPGTLLVMPFIDMAHAIRKLKLPGAARAARAAVVWAQNNVDKDWKEWNGEEEDEEV